MYSLIYNLKINERSVSQKILINDAIVITFLNEKKSIYIKKHNKSYLIDSEKQQLSLIDDSIFKKQNELLSKQIGIVDIVKEDRLENIFGFKSKSYNCSNSIGSLNCKIKTIDISGLELTSYNNYFNFNMRNQLLEIPFEQNELLVCNNTELNFNGIKQIMETELISIEEIEIGNEFLQIKDYKIL